MELYKNRDWLYQKYIVEKLSSTEIAKLCRVDPSSIRSLFKKYNIKKRPRGENGII